MGFLTAITALVTAYSVYDAKERARKAKNKAKDAAEERKGFELVTDGAVSSLPKVYGRALIGGTRVFHATSNNFNYVASNADKQFVTADPRLLNPTIETISSVQGDNLTFNLELTAYIAGNGSALDHSISGSKNEFLYIQQALCQGPIKSVRDILIEENLSYTDPLLGNNLENKEGVETKAGFRADCHYGATPVADAIITANLPGRSTALFTKAASLSAVVKLSRDDPQFSRVIDIKSFLEGSLIRTFLPSGAGWRYSNVGELAYSTNNAEVLLDYLIDPIAGKGLPLSKINLESFKKAADICKRIVKTSAITGGRIWSPTDQVGVVLARDLPLYEANIVIDVTKPVRENVSRIVATMPTARLVWSQGQYKLQMQVPLTNNDIEFAGELTDDDFALGSSFEINEPSSDERLNFATVRFSNEAIDFKEDSVSWPPKQSGTYLKGVGASFYAVVGGWGTKNAAQLLLNALGVWNGGASSSTMSWKFVIKNGGSHTFKWAVDNNGSLSVNIPGQSTISRSLSYSNTDQFTFTANKNDIITVNVTVTDSGGLYGFAGQVSDSGSGIPWTSRSPAYTDFVTVTQSNTVYNTLLAEDNGVLLESDTFVDTITNYYHALAKAEELVRTSRIAATVNFKYIIKDKFYEPGDFIKLNSDTLNLNNLIVLVEDIKLSEDATAEVTGTRFDASQLAWNVADDVYVAPQNGYSLPLSAPTNLKFDTNTTNPANSAGLATWDAVSDDVSGYIVYTNESGNFTANGFPLFNEVGRTPKTSFEIPKTSALTGLVGVRAYSKTNKSELVYTGGIVFNNRKVVLTPSNPGFLKSKLGVLTPAQIMLTATITGYINPKLRWYLDDVLATVATETLQMFDEHGQLCEDEYSNVIITETLNVNGTIAYNGRTLTVEPFTSATFKSYRLEVREAQYENSNVSLISQSGQLYSIEEPADASRIVLNNEVAMLLADAAGVVASYPSVAAVVKVFEGDVDSTSQWTITKTNTSGLTTTLVNNSGSIQLAVTNMIDSLDLGYVTLTATKASKTITKDFTIVKVKAGSIGQNARTISLSASAQAIAYENSGLNPTPSSTTITATAFNTQGTPYYEFTVNGVVAQNNTSNTFVYSAPVNYASFPIQIAVKLREVFDNGTILATDSLSVIGLRPGVNGADGQSTIQGYLTNEGHTAPATAEGYVLSLANAGGTFFVFEGLSDVTGLCTFNILNGDLGTVVNIALDESNATMLAEDSQTILTETQGNPSLTNTFEDENTAVILTEDSQSILVEAAEVLSNDLYVQSTINGLTFAIAKATGVYSLSGEWSLSSDSVTFKVTASYNTVTILKEYTITKSKAGRNGLLYQVTVTSSNGNIFRTNQSLTTTLGALVFENGVDITSLIPANRFVWRRASLVPRPSPYDDAAWNATHSTGYKQIRINVDDVYSKATFFCDVLNA